MFLSLAIQLGDVRLLRDMSEGAHALVEVELSTVRSFVISKIL